MRMQMHSKIHTQSELHPRRCTPGSFRGRRPRARSGQVVHAALGSARQLNGKDMEHLIEAARISDELAGLTQPHPNAGCVLVAPDGTVLTSALQRAQGTVSAEVQAIISVKGSARGATAYVNLEPGDCHGDNAAVQAILQGGVQRVVVGIRHPLQHLRGSAIKQLRSHGVQVDVLSELPAACKPEVEAEARQACVLVNEPLIHRAALRRPLSILKYAMTMDGKIACQTGHSAWVSSSQARAKVFEQRARSDAVIVGGNTVRRDNPRLTTRREGPCHLPVRVVMSRSLNLPEDAALWDVSSAPTILMTQKGARSAFQAKLRDRGVEVVEFDFLTPEGVSEYCYERGFLQVFWECGGVLAAPCISSSAIHKIMAFVAPKIIGGSRAPTPVGDLGFVEMTQAVDIINTQWSQVGPDLMLTGYLPTSGGPKELEAMLARNGGDARLDLDTSYRGSGSLEETDVSSRDEPSSSSKEASESWPPKNKEGRGPVSMSRWVRKHAKSGDRKVAQFYKAWDEWGALSNFSPHPISIPVNSFSRNELTQGPGELRTWSSVEHFYQAMKFGVGAQSVDTDGAANAVLEAIARAESPEEAARIGRFAERTTPWLMRSDWDSVKLDVMYKALRAKFTSHEGPKQMLLDSEGWELVEASPHDFFWGHGYDGTGSNHLGELLMRIREELKEA